MLLIGTKNVTSQDVLANGTIDVGSVYRKYCKKCPCGLPTFTTTSNGITLNGQGVYHLTATFVGTATEEGDVTIQLLVNGEAVPAVLSTETITTADTEFRTFVIDYYILVDSACLLNTPSTLAKTISFQNTGVDATFTSVIVNVSKEV